MVQILLIVRFCVGNNMWKDNKYTKWYLSIIERSKSRVKGTGYYERHHIIPKSLGGSNDKGNLVNLTAREHFLVHLMLIRMCDNQNDQIKMIHAAWFFQGNLAISGYKINSRTHEILKLQKINAQKNRKQTPEEIEKRINSCTGLKRTEEQKKRMSEAQQEYFNTKFNSVESSLRVKIGMANMTDEARVEMKERQSLAKLGKPGPVRADEVYQKIAEKNRGRKNTEESKDKMSLSKLKKFGIKEPKFKDVIIWEILCPDSTILEITNLNKWAKDNNLSPKAMYSTENKDRTCNGFKVYGRKIITVQTVHSQLSSRQERLLTGTGY